jgi:hypothetical protein
MYPGPEDIGAGLTQGKPIEIPNYKYPQIVTLADRDENEVYAVMQAIDEAFGLYKSTLPLMARWSIDKSGKPPAGVPFHKGAVKYLREKGLWTESDESWNKERTERQNKVLEAWKTVKAEAIQKNIKGAEFSRFWVERKKAMVGGFCKEVPPEIR